MPSFTSNLPVGIVSRVIGDAERYNDPDTSSSVVPTRIVTGSDMTVALTDAAPSFTVHAIAPDGRELSVVITLSAIDPDANPVEHHPWHAVFLDTNDWEPGPDTLHVNVNDGEVFGYESPQLRYRKYCPVGTVATIGHPANRILTVKGESGWRYVESGKLIDSDSLAKSEWDIVSVPE